MTKTPASLTAALAGAALVAVALAGCGSPGGPTGGGGAAGDVELTIDDLRGLVQAGDGLSTLDFEATEITTTAGEDSETISGNWEGSGGDPAACYQIYAGSYLLDGSEDGAGGDDDTMELAVFTEQADDDFGLVIVNGRIFDSSDAAAAFIDSVDDYANACPDGYTLSDGGDVFWESTGFTTGTFAGAPDGIRSATAEETVATEGAGLKTTYLQRGNAVLAFYAETYEGGTFETSDVDPVVSAAAERLAALT